MFNSTQATGHTTRHSLAVLPTLTRQQSSCGQGLARVNDQHEQGLVLHPSSAESDQQERAAVSEGRLQGDSEYLVPAVFTKSVFRKLTRTGMGSCPMKNTGVWSRDPE